MYQVGNCDTRDPHTKEDPGRPKGLTNDDRLSTGDETIAVRPDLLVRLAAGGIKVATGPVATKEVTQSKGSVVVEPPVGDTPQGCTRSIRTQGAR